MPDAIVEGYELSKPGNAHDGAIVQILARVRDAEAIELFGVSFFVALPNGEVILAQAEQLTPWFQL